MSKKAVYFFSAFVMLVIAVVLALVLRQPVPSNLLEGSNQNESIQNTGQTVIADGSVSQTDEVRKTQELPPVENLIEPNFVVPSPEEIQKTIEANREKEKTEENTSGQSQGTTAETPTDFDHADAEAFLEKALSGEITDQLAFSAGTQQTSEGQIANPESPQAVSLPASPTNADTTGLETSEKSTTPPSAPSPASDEVKTAETPTQADNQATEEVIADKQNDLNAEMTLAPAVEVNTKDTKSISITDKEIITATRMIPREGATVLHARMTMDGNRVRLLLTGSQEMKGSTFILENPNRVVFDILGKWQINVPRLVSNRMVKNIRVGFTDTHTRLVFDLKLPVKASNVKQMSDKSIELLFQ